MTQMGVDQADWDSLQGERDPFWVKIRQRSPMNHMKPLQLFELAKKDGVYKRTEQFETIVHNDYAGLTQTKAIEDGVREERAGEQNTGFTKVKTGERCWDELVQSSVLHTKHRFKQIPWRDQIVPRGLKTASVSELFRIRPKAVPKEYKNIVTFQQKAPYVSSAPLLHNASVEDRALHRHLRATDNLGAGKSLALYLGARQATFDTQPSPF